MFFPLNRLWTTELHRDAFCQFPPRWIYYYGSNESTGKETGKTHLCALWSLDRPKTNDVTVIFFSKMF